MNWILFRWHTMLNMPRYDEVWHTQDMADELLEYHEATGLIAVWSELSDVTYTYTRAQWSGHTAFVFPLPSWRFYPGIIYMLPKYTLRWLFFRKLGHHFDKNLHISEVRNPNKIQKLKVIAEKHNLDPSLFQSQAEKMLKCTFLLK